MKHYVYIITNIINEKQYVGDHSTNNLDDGYLGSGSVLKKSFKKYGKENFKKEILEFFNSKEESYSAQEKYINHFNTLVPLGYNISPKGGYGIPDSMLNEETKRKIGLAHKGKKSEYLGVFNTENKKGRSYEDQLISIYGIKEGIKRAKLYKEKIRNNTSGENNPMFGKGDLIKGEKNGMFQKHHSEEAKRKMRKPRSDKGKINIKKAQQKRREKEKLLNNLNLT